jgi:zinc protease
MVELPKLAYKVHPYLWPTIGKEIDHIKYAVMDDVKAFFKTFYCPNNAILVVSGNVTVEEVKDYAINGLHPYLKVIHLCEIFLWSPNRQKPRKLELERNVPANAIYKAYHMGKPEEQSFYSMELLADILTDGNASRSVC